MKVNAFFYSLNQGLKNILRNKLFSIASIITMTACIFMFGLFFSVLINFQHAVKGLETGVAITVFFDEGTEQTVIDEVGAMLEAHEAVSEVDFVTAEETWAEYQREYFGGDSAAAESFAGDNPLVNKAHYDVYMEDVALQASLVEELENTEGISNVNHSDMVANVLSDLNSLITYISVAIIVILICVSILLISNTVRTGITVRREEIKIMKMIGATDRFVRAPFIVEGVLIGLIGSIIPLIIIYVLYEKIIGYIGVNFSFLNNMITFIPVADVFQVLLPVGLVLGVGIGFIGSRFTLHRHLHV